MSKTVVSEEAALDVSLEAEHVRILKQSDEQLKELARAMVEIHPRFAWEVVYAWLEKHEHYVIPRDSRLLVAEQLLTVR